MSEEKVTPNKETIGETKDKTINSNSFSEAIESTAGSDCSSETAELTSDSGSSSETAESISDKKSNPAVAAASALGSMTMTAVNDMKNIRLLNLLCLFAAGCINAVGVNMFLAPVNLYDSGISGTSMLLAGITPEDFSLSLFLVILNIPLFLFGMKKQGLLFTVYSVWSVVIYSVASYVINSVLPIDVATASPFAGQDLLLCAVFGGLISGIGSGITIRYGGAIDGIEVLAVIFAKPIGLTVGTFVMVYNVILYIIIGCLFQSWILPLYSIITYTVALKAVDFIVEGLDKAKAFMIITTKEDEICAAISGEFGHGITMINAKGYYSQQHKCAIYVVVNRFQIAKLKNIIHTVDKNAFITISDISDVFGSSLGRK